MLSDTDKYLNTLTFLVKSQNIISFLFKKILLYKKYASYLQFVIVRCFQNLIQCEQFYIPHLNCFLIWNIFPNTIWQAVYLVKYVDIILSVILQK